MDILAVGAALALVKKKVGDIGGAITEALAAAAAARDAASGYADIRYSNDMAYTILQAEVRDLRDRVETLEEQTNALV